MAIYNQLKEVQLSTYDQDTMDADNSSPSVQFQEDFVHYKAFRYPRALEVLGVRFKNVHWGMLALSAPEYIQKRRSYYYPTIIDDKEFFEKWSYSIGKLQRLGRRCMSALLNYRCLQDPAKRDHINLYEYVSKMGCKNIPLPFFHYSPLLFPLPLPFLLSFHIIIQNLPSPLPPSLFFFFFFF